MKKRITAIILTLCFTFILMPFSVVKARTYISTYGDIYKGSQIIGKWTTYYIVPDSNDDIVYTTFFENNSLDYTAGLIFAINFNSYCNGSIAIDFIQDNSNYLYFVEYDGICTWSRTVNSNTGNSTYTINLHDTSYIYLHIYKPSYVDTNNFVSYNYINVSNTVPGNMLPSDYLTYQIPSDRLMAFNFALKIGDYIHYDNSTPYPYVNIKAGSTVSIYVSDGDVIYVAYFIPPFGPRAETFTRTFVPSYSSSGSHNLTEEIILPSNTYQLSNGEYFICRKLTYSGNAGALTFTTQPNTYIRPIYFGKEGMYISEETRGIMGLDNFINNPNEDMDDIADDLGDLHDEENDIIGGFESDLTDFNTDMDLDDYDFITDLNDSNTYFKMVLNDVFTNSSSVRAFWVIPLILVIITALLGR